MDDVYKVGALCQFISSKKKKDKTNDVIKKGNVESLPIQETNSKDSSTNENFENHKKRKSKKNINLPLIKKKKKVKFEIDIDKKSKTKKNEDVTVGANLKNIMSNTFTKTTKKQKEENDNCVESDNNSNSFGKRNSSKSPNIKNSAEYLEQESRTVFVGNVPVNIKMSTIKNVFKTFGEIETMRLRNVAVNNLNVPKRVSVIKKNFHPQRDTANVYIRYKTIDQAQNALKLNATEFKGHKIRVDMALCSNHKQNKEKNIFIGNLPYAIQEDELWEFFKNCGIISAVRIIRDNATGICKGFGYVNFKNKESVELALQLNGKKIQNREIRIKRIKASVNTSFNKKSISFKKTDKPVSSQSYRGHIEPSKTQKKKVKLTKTDLMRRKIAKQLNS